MTQEIKPAYKMKWEKGFYVTGAIYRMMRLKKINKEQAIELLHSRAGVAQKTCRATVELWLTSYPMRHLVGAA